MIRYFKQSWCKHRYELLTTYEKDIDEGVGYDKQTMFVMYCPRCEKQIEELEWVYKAMMERQKINDRYEQARQKGNN